ncbi:MAG: D-aminoacylase [Chloroflexota bacterium]
MFDIIIKNGTIIDGAQTARYQADIAIKADKIVQIGRLGEAEAAQVVDATGKIVAPGFVDVHNHSDAWLLKEPHFFSKTSQGFTTEVIMADGISYAPVNAHTAREWIYYLRSLNGLRFEEYQGWESLADYMALLDGKTVQNSITHIPYANVRTLACGFGPTGPNDYQMMQIIQEIEKGMAEGAVGLSTGLDYIVQFFATTDELVEVCRPMAANQGLYVSHVRYKKGVINGVKEAVEIGKRAGVPVHISHLKGYTPQEVDELIDYIDNVARQTVDFSFDVYPYMSVSTMFNSFLPYEVWVDGPLGVIPKLRIPEVRQRFADSPYVPALEKGHIAWVPGKDNALYQGRDLSEYVAASQRSPADALLDLLIEENLAVLGVYHGNSAPEDLIAPFIQHPCYMMGSDGIYHPDSHVHPRQYGSAPRVLGPYVRDKQWLSLEDAIHKLSGYPAERFGLKHRGKLQESYYADIVIFNPDTIQDQATHEKPHQYPIGIDEVFVNGVLIIEQGAPVEPLNDPLPGRALKFGD